MTKNPNPSSRQESGPSAAAHESVDFIRTIVGVDVAAGKNEGYVTTRFPPEPNGLSLIHI